MNFNTSKYIDADLYKNYDEAARFEWREYTKRPYYDTTQNDNKPKPNITYQTKPNDTKLFYVTLPL
jgi:hypothetical protein